MRHTLTLTGKYMNINTSAQVDLATGQVHHNYTTNQFSLFQFISFGMIQILFKFTKYTTVTGETIYKVVEYRR